MGKTLVHSGDGFYEEVKAKKNKRRFVVSESNSDRFGTTLNGYKIRKGEQILNQL